MLTPNKAAVVPLLAGIGPDSRQNVGVLRRGWLLVILVLVGCASEGGTSGRLAVSSDLDGDWELVVVDVANSMARKITDNMAFDWGPVFSADGNRIMYASDYDAGVIQDLIIYDDDGVPSQVVKERTRDRNIFSIGSDGSNSVRLTENPATDDQPAWSSDGHHIAFVSDRTGDVEIFSMDSGGENTVQLTDTPGTDWSPEWSPNGDQIAFASDRTGTWEIYVMDADGTNVRQFSDSPGDNQGPAWSPNGDQIAFGSNRTGDFEIYVKNLQSGEVQQLTDSPGTDFEPVWSPDGNMIAFASARAGPLEVFLMSADGNNATALKLRGVPSSWVNGS